MEGTVISIPIILPLGIKRRVMLRRQGDIYLFQTLRQNMIMSLIHHKTFLVIIIGLVYLIILLIVLMAWIGILSMDLTQKLIMVKKYSPNQQLSLVRKLN